MFDIIINNFGFWFNVIIPICVGAYFFFNKNNKEFTIQEFGIHVAASFTLVLLSYLILFGTTTDLQDKQYLNSKIASVHYYEEWTELVTYSESYTCGKSTCYRTKTRHDYHPEYWKLVARNGYTEHISKKSFDNYTKYAGTTKTYKPYRSDQISWNDGHITDVVLYKDFLVTYDESYTNYVVAAKLNVINSKVDETTVQTGIKDGSLLPYPTLTYVNNEKILPRVITNIKLNSNEFSELHKQLYELNLLYSEYKQCNILLYITDKDRDFVETLKYYWKNGKKNDIVVIVSIDTNKNIQWTDVITYTNNTNFIVDIQNIKGNINNIVQEIEKFIPEYKRKPMEEFKYLAENIELDFGWNLLIIMLNIVCSILLLRYFHKN